MRKNRILSIFVVTFALFSQTPAQNSTPKATAEAFYGYDLSHPQTFNRRNVDARKRWFSAELYSLFLNELKREEAFLKSNPGEKPFFGDGLPFRPLQENCQNGPNGRARRATVKQETRKGGRAVATVTFAYPKPCPNPDPVLYTLGMIRTRSGWVIDDINYGEDTTLKQRLRRAEY